jgi:hypothetical protein
MTTITKYQKFYETGDANEILGSGRFDAQNKKAAYTIRDLAASHCEIEERFLDCVPPRAHTARRKKGGTSLGMTTTGKGTHPKTKVAATYATPTAPASQPLAERIAGRGNECGARCIHMAGAGGFSQG